MNDMPDGENQTTNTIYNICAGLYHYLRDYGLPTLQFLSRERRESGSSLSIST